MCKRLIIIVTVIFVAGTANASVCAPGYYPSDDDTCVKCGRGYFCDNDIRYNCHDFVASPQRLIWATTISGETAASADECFCEYTGCSNDSATNFVSWEKCNHEPTCDNLRYIIGYWDCAPGYYGVGYDTSPTAPNRYRDCAPCSNKPEHSTYTGYGTPGESGRAENNCPWECDCGYVKENNTCVPAGACTAGISTLRIGKGQSFNLYGRPSTNPSIHILYNSTECYVCLRPDEGGLNIQYDDRTYHAAN